MAGGPTRLRASTRKGSGTMNLTICPECAELAEVQWRAVLESTDGPIEHAKILCVRRHWFLLPVAALAGSPAH